jgi:ribosome-associated toxin RatA of RatAB toxin-antitoxin module
MTTLFNEITIEAPIQKIWEVLTNVEELEQYDPTVKSSTARSESKRGLGASRKVEMKDGKNWFEEKVTEFKPNESLIYELTACSFPIHHLKHSYHFEEINGQTKVSQRMDYQMKFGLFGKLMDWIMVRRQSDKGIKLFFNGLKSHIEKK